MSFLSVKAGAWTNGRLLAVNMLGGIVVSAIAVLSLLLEEAYLLDISFIYALISFLAVVVLAQVYITALRGNIGKRNAHASGEEKASDERY